MEDQITLLNLLWYQHTPSLRPSLKLGKGKNNSSPRLPDYLEILRQLPPSPITITPPSSTSPPPPRPPTLFYPGSTTSSLQAELTPGISLGTGIPVGLTGLQVQSLATCGYWLLCFVCWGTTVHWLKKQSPPPPSPNSWHPSHSAPSPPSTVSFSPPFICILIPQIHDLNLFNSNQLWVQ